MDGKVLIYTANGELFSTKDFNIDSLNSCNGVKARIVLKSGEIKEGFVDVHCCDIKELYNEKIGEYIELWTIANLDEEKHKVIGELKANTEIIKVSDINYIEMILHSHPKWGGILTNKFKFSKDLKKQ